MSQPILICCRMGVREGKVTKRSLKDKNIALILQLYYFTIFVYITGTFRWSGMIKTKGKTCSSFANYWRLGKTRLFNLYNFSNKFYAFSVMDFIRISTKDFVSFFHVSRWEIDKIECSKKYRTQMWGIELFDAKCCKRVPVKRKT